MKTKHFFYSMALVAVLGACSSEELEVANTNVQDLSNRPLVGDIELTVDDIQTRFAAGTDGAQPVFADGDKLGACIIDVPNYNLTNNTYANALKTANGVASKLYDIVEYYSSNNAFTRTDGVWKVDQPLVEGNYLFYAPYNQKMQARTPLKIEVPVHQTATSEKSALDEFYKSGKVVRVGYQFLAANGGVAQKPNVVMHDVFAYPLFTIKNNFKGLLKTLEGETVAFNGGKIKLDSIQIHQVAKANLADVAVNWYGNMKHAESSATAATATEGVVGKMKPAGAWSTSPMATFTDELLSTTVKDNSSSEGARQEGVITTLICYKEIEAGGEYKVHGVLPAKVYTDNTNSLRVKLYVVINGKHYVIEDATVTSATSSDVTTYTIADQKGGSLLTSAAGTVTLIKGQKYPQEELNFEDGKITAKNSKGSILTIDLKGGFGKEAPGDKAQVAIEWDPSTPAAATVIKTNAEFEAFFKEQLNGTQLTEGNETKDNTFKLATSGRTLTINGAMIDALFTYNNKGSLTINTALPIAKDVKIVNVDNANGVVTFKSANNNEYEINLGTGYVIGTTSVAVAAGETKTVIINDACTTFTNSGTIETLYVVAGKSLTTSAAVTVKGDVINDGTINVASSFGLTPASLVNRNELEVNAAVGNIIENNGTIEVKSGAGITVNAGTGKIKIAESLVNANGTLNDVTVVVTGGTQEGICTGTLNKASVEKAEKVAWIKSMEQASSAVDFNAEVIGLMKNIKKIYAVGATFTAGTFDMSGKTLVMTGNSAKTISGAGIQGTTVNNVTILNAGNSDVTLDQIAANGDYTNAAGVSAKIKTNGTSATWNGKNIN